MGRGANSVLGKSASHCLWGNIPYKQWKIDVRALVRAAGAAITRELLMVVVLAACTYSN
jgi:hypothetical protein